VALVSLTTDFGTRDEYVGVMKAVIWGIAPGLGIVDISHQVAPQDRHQAAFLLKSAYPYFAPGSVHVVVVDPGVGSRRRIVAMHFEGHYFIAPDNGIFSLLLTGRAPDELIAVDRHDWFLPQVSRTFHGRDIFAPVAAHLAAGKSLGALGTTLAMERLHHLPAPRPPQRGQGYVAGSVVQVDHFGNLTTNIDHGCIKEIETAAEAADLKIHVADQVIRGLSTCYADAAVGAPLVLMGSRGLLEIAVNQGDARRYFKVARGDAVRLEW
jgi:S-adenosyl-L-methionine hydrolase (adenosine-forming)